MRKLLVTLDDDLSNLLAKYPNQNEVVRKALYLYIGDITTDTVQGLRESYARISKQLTRLEALTRETDSKVDYIAERVK